MSRLRNERGQAFVLMTLGLVVLLAMSAFAIDVGSWYRTDRRLQGTADAAALAGAQMLPGSPSGAKSLAMEYAGKNGGDVAAGDIKVEKTFNPNDTMSVKAAKADPGFFSKVLGVDTVNISASAKARVDSPRSVRFVAPMVVHCDHEFIKNCDGSGHPKFGSNFTTRMLYDQMGAPGAFGMLNLSDKGGTPGTSEQADWILKGFDKFLELGLYASNTGAKFSSAEIQGALDARIGTELLFPVFRTLTGTGSNAQYDIIGWIGFHLTGYTMHGHNAELEGYFTEYIAHGILASSGSGIPPSFGVKSIQLID
jgi:Putative Flp pilus-assembly TadE/G-like